LGLKFQAVGEKVADLDSGYALTNEAAGADQCASGARLAAALSRRAGRVRDAGPSSSGRPDEATGF